MKEVTYTDWKKNPTPRLMWVLVIMMTVGGMILVGCKV